MSPSPHSHWQELLPLRALDALEATESEALGAHLAGCESCRLELEALRRDLQLLAESVPPVQPPPGVRDELLARLPAPPRPASLPVPTEPASLGLFSWRTLAVAAGIAAVVLGVVVTRQEQRLDRMRVQRDLLVSDLEDRVARISELEAESTALARELGTLTSPRARQVVLAGLERAPDATALAYVDPGSGQARFYVFELPVAPTDRDYQLWVITDGVPASAGVFDVDEHGTARLELDDLPTPDVIDAWAVTLEPAGGLDQPSGPMVLLST